MKPTVIKLLPEGKTEVASNALKTGEKLRLHVMRYNPADPASVPHLQTYELEQTAGMTLFEFGQTFNKHSVWEIRGFSSPDFPALPQNFDLYRPDNTVAGGSYYAPFDAWLVPR